MRQTMVREEDVTEEIKVAAEKGWIKEGEKKLVSERRSARRIAEQLFHTFSLVSVCV